MGDMLVNLVDLPYEWELFTALKEEGVSIQRAFAPDKTLVLDWVKENFSQHWRDECDVSFGNNPISTYLAVEEGKIIGFACYDATTKNFFGPTGVLKNHRSRGIGKALLLRCLYSMREAGYAYAVIGGAGPVGFYQKTVGATVIPDSDPGIYKNFLKK